MHTHLVLKLKYLSVYFLISSVSSTLYFIATWLLHIPCELLQLISQSQTIMFCKLLEKNDPIELIIALLHLWCMYIYKVLCNRVQTETLVDFYNESPQCNLQ
jgi:hypothetical protein